jgi:phosphoenolpyruvate-protein kinase (PTS system EI component)
VADFFSIGTNDLAQYVLAVDRGNPSVADHFDALHPSVLGLVRQTVAAGESTGTPVAVCGEVVSDILAIPILVGLGLNELSLPPSYLPTARKIILDIAHADASVLAEEAYAAPDAETVRQLARDWIHRHVDDERVTGALSLSNGTDSDTVG